MNAVSELVPYDHVVYLVKQTSFSGAAEGGAAEESYSDALYGAGSGALDVDGSSHMGSGDEKSAAARHERFRRNLVMNNKLVLLKSNVLKEKIEAAVYVRRLLAGGTVHSRCAYTYM